MRTSGRSGGNSRSEVEKQQRLEATLVELLAAIAAGFSSEMELDAISDYLNCFAGPSQSDTNLGNNLMMRRAGKCECLITTISIFIFSIS